MQMKLKKVKIFLSKPLTLLTFGSAVVFLSVTASALEYSVKEGDTLSEILSRFNLYPLYGKNGFVKKTIHMNKSKIKKNGSFIRVGTLIELPMKSIAHKKDKAPLLVAEKEPEVLLPETASAPPPALLRNPSDSDEFPFSYFQLTPFVSFLRVDSNNANDFGGSQVTLLSKRGLGLKGSWNIAYDEKRTFFGFAIFEHFSLFTDPDFVFNHSSISRFHFGVGSQWKYSDDLSLTTKASLQEVSFLDVVNPLSVNVASITLPELSAGLKKSIATKKSFEANVGGRVALLLPSSTGSYHSKLGVGAGASLELRHKEKSLELAYDYRSLKISNIKNSESSIALMMNFSFDSSK